MKATGKKNRRSFDEEFKRSAVEMIESGARSATQLGTEVGVSNWSLSHAGRRSTGGPRTSQRKSTDCGMSWRP